MDVLILRYYNINRFLLLIIGSWPMTKKSFLNVLMEKIIRFIVYTILISSVLVQIFKFITTELTLDLFVNIFSYVFICLIYLGKYGFYLLQLENLKCLIIRIQRNWHLLIDEKELEIMEKYTQQGKKFTFVCLMLSCATIIILLVWTSFLFIYDIVVPLNGTHRLQSPFVAEYFIDEDIYFYPILLHMYTIFLVGLMVVIATETFYTICMQHACGLFQIVGYRFERIFNQSTSSSITLQEMNLKFDDWVSRAIQSHQTAIAFVDHMNSCFTMSYFWLLILAVLALTMNCTDNGAGELRRYGMNIAVINELKYAELKNLILLATLSQDPLEILQAVNPNKNYNLVNSSVRIINAFVRIVNIVCYLFGVFYCGQRIIDHSTGISEKVYAIPWFLESSKIQTTIIIVLQRSFKESVLLAGGLYPMSFELLEVILRTTSCYITTLHALQN